MSEGNTNLLPEAAQNALSLHDFLHSGPKLQVEAVPMPLWGPGRVVYVRGLTAGEVDSWRQSLIKGFDGAGKPQIDSSNSGLKLLARAVCDASGARLVPDTPAAELVLAVEQMRHMPSAAMEALTARARALSGLNDEEKEGNESASSPTAGA